MRIIKNSQSLREAAEPQIEDIFKAVQKRLPSEYRFNLSEIDESTQRDSIMYFVPMLRKGIEAFYLVVEVYKEDEPGADYISIYFSDLDLNPNSVETISDVSVDYGYTNIDLFELAISSLKHLPKSIPSIISEVEEAYSVEKDERVQRPRSSCEYRSARKS